MVVHGSFKGRSGGVLGLFGVVPGFVRGSFGSPSGVVQVSFGGRSAVVQGSFENFRNKNGKFFEQKIRNISKSTIF